jgi:hypothetical protein
MGRLTIPDVRVDERTTRRSVIDVAAVREHAMEFYCRLKAYEDIGLTPEEIKAPFTEDTMINLAAQALGVDADRLRELAEADKDGRVVVLPCKVGDTVYMIERIFDIDNGVRDEICARKVIGHGGNNLNKLWLIGSGGICNVSIFVSEFGKTVFLTHEEAKKALEERAGKKDG